MVSSLTLSPLSVLNPCAFHLPGWGPVALLEEQKIRDAGRISSLPGGEDPSWEDEDTDLSFGSRKDFNSPGQGLSPMQAAKVRGLHFVPSGTCGGGLWVCNSVMGVCSFELMKRRMNGGVPLLLPRLQSHTLMLCRALFLDMLPLVLSL